MTPGSLIERRVVRTGAVAALGDTLYPSASLAEGLLFERREFHATFGLDDQKEGMRAFVEKRKPAFKHR